MEVASAAPNLLHSKKGTNNGWQDNVHALRRHIAVPSNNSRFNMDSKNNADSDGDNGEIPTLTCSDVVIVLDDDKERASDNSRMSPTRSLTPPPILEAMYDGQLPSGSSESTKPEKRVYNKRNYNNNDGEVKRNRITRNRDDPNDIVNNYVDPSNFKQPRPVNPPTGGYRNPYQLPKLDIEKEKDRLKIHMVGPKTRETRSETEERIRTKRKFSEIGVGDAFQAVVPNVSPGKKKARSNYADDRDELIWVDSKAINGKEKELDEAWNVIRRQFRGKIGLDVVLNRLMKCNYDIAEMLRTIEKELFESLPQPFEKLNVIQQREFERLLRKPGNSTGKHREGEKIFRQFQEKFLKTYYMGEILNYYYNTKRRGCYHELYQRCQCRENMINEKDIVERYECVNCTKYIWGNTKRLSERYCDLCEYYYGKYREHRIPQAFLIEPDHEIAQKWYEVEKEKRKAQPKEEILRIIETERQVKISAKPNPDEIPTQHLKGRSVKLSKDVLCEYTKKFEPPAHEKCSLIKSWGNSAVMFAFKQYSNKELLAFVKSFYKYGVKLDNIAADLKVSTIEVNTFYKRFRTKFRLDKLTDRLTKRPDSANVSPPDLDTSFSITPDLSSTKKKKNYVDESKTHIASNSNSNGHLLKQPFSTPNSRPSIRGDQPRASRKSKPNRLM